MGIVGQSISFEEEYGKRKLDIPHWCGGRYWVSLYTNSLLKGLGPKGHPSFVKGEDIYKVHTRARRRPSGRSGLGTGRVFPKPSPILRFLLAARVAHGLLLLLWSEESILLSCGCSAATFQILPSLTPD
ncbi:hypothetical protein Dimus_039022 [Dionaea muscipula]